MRIVFTGVAGSGKSTLASSVFAALKNSGRNAEHLHEFVRNDIHSNGKMTSIWEQYRTRQHQKELEDAVPSSVDYIICDSGTMTPYFYACLYSNPIEPRQRLVLQDMYKYLLDDLYLKRYDMVFYLPLIGKVNLKDGTRYQTEDEIKVLDEHMRLFFTKLHHIPNVHVVDTGFEQRVDTVMWKILGEDKLTLNTDIDSILNTKVDTINLPDMVGNQFDHM